MFESVDEKWEKKEKIEENIYIYISMSDMQLAGLYLA